MEEDSEKQILEGMADLNREIGKLRSDCKKLSKRINHLELQGFQDQLNTLNDSLLETQRELARLDILYAANVILGAAESQIPKTSNHFTAQLRVDAGRAQAEVDKSEEPIKVAAEFAKRSCGDAEKLGIKLVVI
jgi:major membrane immunogen (membrane-anchored lipoprotein)